MTKTEPGFTWKDVDLLRMYADHARLDYPHHYKIPNYPAKDPLQDLADRIAAQLPPREEDDA